jgi:glutamyl-tRNA reductase
MGKLQAMASSIRSELRVASITLGRASASVEVRERLTRQEWGRFLEPFAATMREWALLSTCHRFELYLAAESDELELLCGQLRQMLSSVLGSVAVDDFPCHDGLCTDIGDIGDSQEVDTTGGRQELWLVRHDSEAADHLCRVAAGLDSLVLGEAQIQGQVISAYTSGLESGSIGPLLSALFRTAIRVGKRARTESQISAHAVSMSSVALSMAARWFPNFADTRVLVIGAGEMSRLALKALFQRRVTNVTVANRTLARAEAALMHEQWRAVELSQLPPSLAEFDIVFSATSAPDYVVTRQQIAGAATNGTPSNGTLANGNVPRVQVLIDLAMPRDVDPTLRDLPHVVVVDVDDLRQGLDQSLDNRKRALPAVNAIIAEELERWEALQRELSIRPYVVELRQRAERIRQAEVERTLRFLGTVDAETSEHIQHLSRALVNKLLHEPTIRIKELAHSDDVDSYMSTICDIFGLEASHSTQDEFEEANSHANPSHPNLSNANLSGEPSI